MNNLVQQGKFELKSAVSKRWYIHSVKEFLISQVPLFGGHSECKFLDILVFILSGHYMTTGFGPFELAPVAYYRKSGTTPHLSIAL